MVFNGEILNYRSLRNALQGPFKTDGDTEVLLELLRQKGPSALKEIRGQYAFAWVHSMGTALTIARDPAGIIPLYYALTDDGVLFGSEIKALLPALRSPSIDRTSLAEFFVSRSVYAPHTLFAGVRKVRPGEQLTFRIGMRQPISGRTAGYKVESAPENDDPADRLDALLNDAVALNLVADVPVGSFLSGGLDSSLVTALASKTATGIHTFSAGFDADGFMDERSHADRVASYLRTHHHEVVLGRRDFLDGLGQLAWHRDAPLSEPADVAVAALARAASDYVKVVLSGEGADELFLGYPKHPVELLCSRLPRVMWAPAARLARRHIPTSRRVDVALRAMAEPSLLEQWLAWFGSFTVGEAARLVDVDMNELRQRFLDKFQALSFEEDATRMKQMLEWDRATWLADNLLERGDRMTMSASVELRPPFLDGPVVSFAQTLSPYRLIRHGGKSLLRDVARRYLPSETVQRRKAGFTMPMADWMRDSRYLREHRASTVGSLLDWDAIDRLIDESRAGSTNVTQKVWTVTSALSWGESVFDSRSGCEDFA